ncbi:MAG: DUF1698 domain-containing protein [Lysobacterales bacterium]|jgi:hypothetical protein
MSKLIDQVRSRQWFYEYPLPDGSATRSYAGAEVQTIHDTRWAMLQRCLNARVAGDRGSLSVLDLASHQGWFAVKMAQAGFGRVLGLDARQSHVEDSRLMAELYGLQNLAFERGDVHEQQSATLGQFDVVLMLGLLYHLENPIGALRTCRDLCRGLCVIETQVVPGITGYVDYGSYRFVRQLKGTFGIIDETADTHGPEASVTGICLVPSLDALLWTLEKVGFSQAAVLEPPEDAYEQLLYHKRVMVVAQV